MAGVWYIKQMFLHAEAIGTPIWLCDHELSHRVPNRWRQSWRWKLWASWKVWFFSKSLSSHNIWETVTNNSILLHSGRNPVWHISGCQQNQLRTFLSYFWDAKPWNFFEISAPVDNTLRLPRKKLQIATKLCNLCRIP